MRIQLQEGPGKATREPFCGAVRLQGQGGEWSTPSLLRAEAKVSSCKEIDTNRPTLNRPSRPGEGAGSRSSGRFYEAPNSETAFQAAP